jgi:hypothetical protein
MVLLLLAAAMMTPHHDAREEALQRTTALWGGWLSNLDVTVPRGAVDIGGSVVRPNAHKLRQVGGGKFLSDVPEPGSPFETGVYWGQHTAASERGRSGARKQPQGRLARLPGAVLPHRIDMGILGRLAHQKAPAPPAWWLKKRQAYLAQRELMRAQRAHQAAARAPPPAPARPAAAVPAKPKMAVRQASAVHVPAAPQRAARPASDFPGEAAVAAAFRRASQLAAVRAEKAQAAAAKKAAEEKAADAAAAKATPAKAAALQHTADSLERLAEVRPRPPRCASARPAPGDAAERARWCACVRR